MADRYFVESPITGNQVRLEGTEAHHLLHVMRASTGDAVVLFDGSGTEFSAEIQRLGRRDVELKILAQAPIDRELAAPLVLGVALPKGDRQKWLVEKLTELGVTQMIPLLCERGVAQPTGPALTRLSRTVIEASKQCGRNTLMNIAEPQAWTSFIETPTDTATRIFAHPHGDTAQVAELVGPVRPIYLAIGPEGGFAPAEVHAALQSGWKAMQLGTRILRIETAALAAVAILAHSRQQ